MPCYHDVSLYTSLIYFCYRCHSPTYIPDPAVYSSWTIVTFTMVRRSVHWLKSCIIYHQCIVLHLLTTNKSANLFFSLITSLITIQLSKPSLLSRHIFNITIMTSQWLQLLMLVMTSSLTKQKIILRHWDILCSWNGLRTVVIGCLFLLQKILQWQAND